MDGEDNDGDGDDDDDDEEWGMMINDGNRKMMILIFIILYSE